MTDIELRQWITETIRKNGACINSLYGALFNTLLKLPIKRFEMQITIEWMPLHQIGFTIRNLFTICEMIIANPDWYVGIISYGRGTSSTYSYVAEFGNSTPEGFDNG